MAKGTFIHKGKILDYTNNTAAAIAYGDVVLIGGRIGIAMEDITIGVTGSLSVEGVYELPADNTAAFAVGDAVYWDNAANQLTKTAGTYKAGYVTEVKAQADAIARVKIN